MRAPDTTPLTPRETDLEGSKDRLEIRMDCVDCTDIYPSGDTVAEFVRFAVTWRSHISASEIQTERMSGMSGGSGHPVREAHCERMFDQCNQAQKEKEKRSITAE